MCRAKQSVTVLSPGEEKSDSGDLTLYSPLKVVLFVVLMCVMLVLMYFYFKYLGELLPLRSDWSDHCPCVIVIGSFSLANM